MGEAFVLRRGNRFEATIEATFPAGWTAVICENSKKTVILAAPADSLAAGSYTFTVPFADTWTVTATEGSKSKSATATITENGQAAAVNIVITLVIFDAGNYAAETGGFSPDNAIASGLLVCSAGSSSYTAVTRAVYSNELIDLTAYSTLYFEIAASAAGYRAEGERKLGISTAADSSNSFYATASNAVGTQTIDLSSVEGAYAIKMFVTCWTNSQGNWTDNTLKVSKIWAE